MTLQILMHLMTGKHENAFYFMTNLLRPNSPNSTHFVATLISASSHCNWFYSTFSHSQFCYSTFSHSQFCIMVKYQTEQNFL